MQSVRFGPQWDLYRKSVQAWRPRWCPWINPGIPPARLYVAAGCGPCSTVGRWFLAHAPIGLKIVAAEEHPSRDLNRITYEVGTWSLGEGQTRDELVIEEGIGAVARALEHIHLGWALVGGMMRLPIIRPILQIIADAVGGGPRLVLRQANR